MADPLRIWKYEFKITDCFHIEMPAKAQFLSAQKQGESFVMWMLVRPWEMKIEREFFIHGTGNPVDSFHPWRHLATIQDGPMVWHLMEQGDPQ
jgi:hypothetical protein